MVEQFPTVSIGMPIYNGARYLRQALDAITGQTFTDFEVVISDNASTDATGEICREYAGKDSRIRYYSNDENRGASWNYNRLLDLARGKYFRWAPADDVFAPESVQACVATLDRHPEAVLCYPKTVLIDEQGNVIRPYEDNLHLSFESAVERFERAMKQIGLVNILYGLIRTDVLRKTCLLGNYSGADVVLVLELSLYGQFLEIAEPLFFRRIHAGAMSSKKNVEADQEFFDPKTKGRAFMRLWRHHFQQELSVLRAPISLSEKGRLSYLVGRSGLASRHELLRELSDAMHHRISRSFRSM